MFTRSDTLGLLIRRIKSHLVSTNLKAHSKPLIAASARQLAGNLESHASIFHTWRASSSKRPHYLHFFSVQFGRRNTETDTQYVQVSYRSYQSFAHSAPVSRTGQFGMVPGQLRWRQRITMALEPRPRP